MVTVMIADDEPEIRHLLRDTLALEGYRVIEASDGPEALALARRELPRLALLDVLMPGLNGFTVCERLKSDPATRGIRVALFTASAWPDDGARGTRSPADGYLAKPYHIRDLLDLLDALHTGARRVSASAAAAR